MTNSNCEIYHMAKDKYQEGIDAFSLGDYVSSVRIFDEGIEIISNHYVTHSVVDDTGLKLTFSQVEQERENFEVSSSLKRTVLESRLDMLRRKMKNLESDSEEK